MNIEDLDREDLLFLIGCYSNYVMDFYEEHDYNDTPVCVYEFLDNDYQNILEEQRKESEC